MAYGSAIQSTQVFAGYANYGNFSQAQLYQPQPTAYSSGLFQMVQMFMQMLQSLTSLQSNWSQMLAGYAQPPAAQTQANYGQASSAYAAPEPAPAAQPQTNVAVAVNVQAEQPAPAAEAAPTVDASSGGGDGGGDGGDPVILDLNGDGKLDTTGANGSKINFNLFGNGTKVKTEWLKAGTRDGLLVADFNGDGKIDSGRELMRTTGVNGEQGKYKDGWDKLSQLFDQNKDGQVNGDELNQLKVWVDKNGDGVSQDGELTSVKELGISQINVGQSAKSSFTMNGKQQLAEDYIFDLEQ
ncbi:MAG: hypothetical protein U0931_18200 [Vulcanimicrobiota bacterium]